MDPLVYAANIAVAFVLGLVIGLERELRHHEAGLRTHALLALGAALFVSLSQLFDHEGSPTRVAGQIVTGVGFLAGGVIIRDGFSVKGLNTAATLWCTAAVGTLAGSGFLYPATVGTAFVLFLHIALRPLTLRLDARLYAQGVAETSYRMRIRCSVADEARVRAAIFEAVVGRPHGIILVGLVGQSGDAGDRVVIAELHATPANDTAVECLAAALLTRESVRSAGWDRMTSRPT